MPKPPRFPTPAGQQIAVGVVTLVVFGVAIGLAQMFTQSQRVSYDVELASGRVAELVLPLPTDWRRDDTAPRGVFTTKPSVFADPIIKGRHLSIARIDWPEPVGSDDVLRVILSNIASNRRSYVQGQKLERFKGLSSVGLYYRGVRHVDDIGLSVSDWLIVLTEDQRRHWMILLSAPTRSSSSAQKANHDLIMQIAQAADDTAILNVNPAGPDNPAATPPEPPGPR